MKIVSILIYLTLFVGMYAEEKRTLFFESAVGGYVQSSAIVGLSIPMNFLSNNVQFDLRYAHERYPITIGENKTKELKRVDVGFKSFYLQENEKLKPFTSFGVSIIQWPFHYFSLWGAYWSVGATYALNLSLLKGISLAFEDRYVFTKRSESVAHQGRLVFGLNAFEF